MRVYARAGWTAVLLLGLLAALGVITASAAPSPFFGLWQGVDVDGSNVSLFVVGGGGGSFRTLYFDDAATVCGLDPDTGEILCPAMARGPATATGDGFVAAWRVWCLAAPAYLWGTVDVTFTYDAGTDTLTDSIGVVWHRP